ncbi:MAG: O-antigen ligase family protein [Candidatus Omnitrophota bacterium]
MLNRSISLTLTFIIFFAPLAFGSVHVWSGTLLELSIALLFFLTVLRSIKEGAVYYRKSVLNIFFLAFAACLFYQLYFKTTLYPYQTYLALKLLLVYFALFASVAVNIRNRDDADRIIYKIITAGSAVSVLGILQLVTGADKIYWLKEFPGRDIFGSFAYGNYFACYVSMISFIALGRLLVSVYEGARISWDLSLKQMLAAMLENVFNKKTLLLACSFAVMVSSLFLSKSRAGMAFFIVSLSFFILLSARQKKWKCLVFILSLGIFVSYLLLNWIDLGRAVRELGTLYSYDLSADRLKLYVSASRILGDYPLTGIGLGAFSLVFPYYMANPGTDFYRYLHSDLLQFVIEIGPLCAVIALLPLVIFLIMLSLNTKRARDIYYHYIGVSVLTASFYLLLHNSVDFCMHANAISSLFIVILALAVSTIRPGDKEDKRPLRTIITLISGGSKALCASVAVLLFFYAAFTVARPYMAEKIVEDKTDNKSYETAQRLDPLNDGLYFRQYYSIFRESAGRDYVNKQPVYEAALGAIDRAIKLNPYNGLYLVSRGELESWAGHYGAADKSFKEAALREPRNALRQIAYAYFLFRLGLSDKDEAARKAALKKGLAYYLIAKSLRQSISFAPLSGDESMYKNFKKSLAGEGIVITE